MFYANIYAKLYVDIYKYMQTNAKGFDVDGDDDKCGPVGRVWRILMIKIQNILMIIDYDHHNDDY